MNVLSSLLGAVALGLGALRGQDGLGMACYQHCWGSNDNVVALAPDLAVERLLVEVQQTLATTNARRQSALDLAPTARHAEAKVLRDEVAAAPAAKRREIMRLRDPAAFCEVWPRNLANADLELEWFVQRHLRAAEPVGQAPLDRYGVAVWGVGSAAQCGGAPFEATPDARKAFLAGLAGAAVEGVVPCLLQAIGGATPELGDAAERRAVWLDVIEHWSAGRSLYVTIAPGPTRSATSSPIHLLTGRTVYVAGGAGEWRAAAEACRRWQVALLALAEQSSALNAGPFQARANVTAVALRQACTMLAEVAALREPRPLTEQEANQAVMLVENRDTLAGMRQANGEQSVLAVSRTVSIAGERAAVFVLERTR